KRSGRQIFLSTQGCHCEKRSDEAISTGGPPVARDCFAALAMTGSTMDTSPRPLALVTGASGGIGAALARELARHGHDLVLAARGVAAMEALAGELREAGAAATVIAADLAKPGAAASLADEIARQGLAIDVLVNNAGLGA